MRRFQPRIHVLLAGRAPVGVVLRRGPSKRVATVLWDRRTDEFRLGQWFEGRIYERRSDLSPDGRYLIYFALDGRWRAERWGAWTAVSRAPGLEPLALFRKGNGWHGGGLWTGDRTYWLNDGSGHSVLHDTTEVRRDTAYSPPADFGGESPGVYYPRLMRDGWRYLGRRRISRWDDVDIFERPAPGGWVLRKLAHGQIGAPRGKGVYWDEHRLIHPATGASIACPDWEWADLDRHRLVWAAGGRLHAAALTPSGLAGQKELYDFDQMRFEP